MNGRGRKTQAEQPPATVAAPARTAVDAARVVVETEREKLARWEADQAAAQAELVSLQDRAGAEVLDDPDAAASLTRKMQELRDRADIAGKAVQAQGPRVWSAESAYLNAEAAKLEVLVTKVRASLDQHQARTAELLAMLEEHEGPYVPERELLEERSSHVRSMGGFMGFTRNLAKSELLQRQVEDAELPVRILRTMAAGQDPASLVTQSGQGVEAYPSCVWGPDALVPAPAYLRSIVEQQKAEQGRQAAIDTARRRIGELEAAIARGDKAPGGRQDWTLSQPEALPEQLEQVRRQLARLTGQTADA